MYVNPDYKSKKEFLQAIKDGKQHMPYIHGGMFDPPRNGSGCVEGPHYPKPHKWYASVIIKEGVIISAK